LAEALSLGEEADDRLDGTPGIPYVYVNMISDTAHG